MSQLETEARPCRHGQASVADLVLGRVIHDLEMFRRPVEIMLVDREIRDAGIDLQCGGRGDRTAADMQLYARAIGFGHRRDFLRLEQAAGIADVGLQYAGDLRLEDGAESVPCVKTLADGDRNPSPVRRFS